MATAKSKPESRDMGTFSVEIGVGNLDSDSMANVLAMVDTGAFDTVLPASLLRRLGLEPVETELYTLADGSAVEYELGTARIGIDGRERFCQVVFGPEGQYLLGATTLELFHLMVDPVDERLVRKPMRARPI